MKHKRLQFLVPQYKETEEVISYLLNSIEYQVDVDKDELGVIICSDGGNYILDQKFLDKYSFDIEYVICDHRGISATRNTALFLSDADYVMFCDADDGFCNTFGIKILYDNLEIGISECGIPVDIISSKFFNEKIDKKWNLYINDQDNVHIHCRLFRRDFLIENNIFFNENVYINEDTFFVMMSDFYSKNKRLLNIPIYCWRYNKNSITRGTTDFPFRVLQQLILTNDDVVELMLILNYDKKIIAGTIFDLICKVYFTLNQPQWFDEKNSYYIDLTMRTFKKYLEKREEICDCLTELDKIDIFRRCINSDYYRNIEIITFDDFLDEVRNYENTNNNVIINET